jgi:hypothetical protein
LGKWLGLFASEKGPSLEVTGEEVWVRGEVIGLQIKLEHMGWFVEEN